jgi:hypothetical protein
MALSWAKKLWNNENYDAYLVLTAGRSRKKKKKAEITGHMKCGSQG